MKNEAYDGIGFGCIILALCLGLGVLLISASIAHNIDALTRSMKRVEQAEGAK